MSEAARIVVDYSSGLAAGSVDRVTVVEPDLERQRHGDPAPRGVYLAAFLEAARAGPTPVVALVGPYGYSPALTAASGARNDLGRQQVHPDSVRVHNTGRAFLGLGAIAFALARAAVPPDAALAWLDEGATGASMWLVARTDALDGLSHELQIEAPDGLPDEEFTLLRVRLASRVLGGFDTAGAACREGLQRASPTGPGVCLVAPGLGLDASAVAAHTPGVEVVAATLSPFLTNALGDCFAFGLAPLPGAQHA